MKKTLYTILTLGVLAALPIFLTAKTGVKIFNADGTVTNITSDKIDHLEFYDSDDVPTLEETLSEIDGLVVLSNDMLGDNIWDEGYVSNHGFVLTSGIGNELETLRRRARAEEGTSGEGTPEDEPVVEDPSEDAEESLPCIGVMNTDKSKTFLVFVDEYGYPTQLSAGANTLYFNYLNEEVLELTLSNGEALTYVATVGTDREAIAEALRNSDFTFIFQARLAVVVALLENAEIPEEFKSAVEGFANIARLKMAENQSATLDNLVESGLLGESGLADFVEDVTSDYIEKITEVKYSIVLWTGKASFKVGGTSCTLSGTIHCASDKFDEYGTYGIVCDTNPENLTVEAAEYVGSAVQKDNSFDVDFRGLKANTTYYYRAYYKFNSEDHGDLVFKYGEPNAEIAYDVVTKDFTTGDNRLEVDVVMCIDVTGSMSGIISTVKSNAMSFYDSFNNKCVENGIQLDGLNNKVIAFQDINVDGDRWWKESEFYTLPDEKESFNTFVSELYADGGGDTPESGLEALMGAFTSLEEAVDDGYHRQVVILWTDAPYLKGSEYTEYEYQQLLDKWDTLSSGRRLIIFAPTGDEGYYSNGGSWDVFNDHKNIIHSSDITASFSDFDYILDSIIEELIGKGDSSSSATYAPKKVNKNADFIKIVSQPNK